MLSILFPFYSATLDNLFIYLLYFCVIVLSVNIMKGNFVIEFLIGIFVCVTFYHLKNLMHLRKLPSGQSKRFLWPNVSNSIHSYA